MAIASTTTTNRRLLDWVDEVTALCAPERVEWCDGSEEEFRRLCELMVDRRGASEQVNWFAWDLAANRPAAAP